VEEYIADLEDSEMLMDMISSANQIIPTKRGERIYPEVYPFKAQVNNSISRRRGFKLVYNRHNFILE
jgi:hypothetical protein